MLTQQIIKQTLLANEEAINTDGVLTASRLPESAPKYQREIKELILAVRVERELSKAEILDLFESTFFLAVPMASRLRPKCFLVKTSRI